MNPPKGKEHFKKGVQYSHYTGSDRQNIIDLLDGCKYEHNREELIRTLSEIQNHVSNLSETIAYLDILNCFK